MRFEEVLPALRAGKRVKPTRMHLSLWRPEDSARIVSLIEDDWEIVIEHKLCWHCGGKMKPDWGRFPRPVGKDCIIRCVECGVQGPFAEIEELAWQLWDKKA
jgi:hypothetical protein